MAQKLADDIVVDILLRLPPDDPACLLRASLVCKRWRRLLAHPSFHRCHRELHRTPSVVGFLRIMNLFFPFASRFVPYCPASGVPAARELPGWLPLDCRHGRALFVTPSPNADGDKILDFEVWNPLTDERRRLPRPPSSPPSDRYSMSGCCFNAVVLCAAAAEGCDHRDCYKGPFLVAFIWSRDVGVFGRVTFACVYSSVTGDWGEVTSVQDQDPYVCVHPCPSPSVLVRDKLHFRALRRSFELQLGTQLPSVMDEPPPSIGNFTSLVLPGDSGLKCADVIDKGSIRLRLWSLETGPNTVSQWTLGRTIELETLLPDGTFQDPPHFLIVCIRYLEQMFFVLPRALMSSLLA